MLYYVAHLFLLSAIFGGAGTAWAIWLTSEEDDMIFDWWPPLMRKISRHPKWAKATYGCNLCVSGQIALWGFPVVALVFDLPTTVITGMSYIVVIFFSIIFARLWEIALDL